MRPATGRAAVDARDGARGRSRAPRLRTGTLDDARRRHAERFLAFAEQAEDGLAGPEQAEWLQRAERELDNVRAALDWCLANGRVAEALQAVSALGRFWRAHGHVTEARRLLARGLAEADALPVEVRARALWTAAHEAMAQSDYRAAVPALEEALAIFHELGDDRHAVFALCELARALSSRDELERPIRQGRMRLRSQRASATNGRPPRRSTRLRWSPTTAATTSARQDYSERSLALRRVLGDAILITSSTNTLGLTAMRAGDLDAAERAFTECLELARGLGENVYVAAALCALGEIALSQDLPELAAERLLEALSLYRELGDERVSAECLHALGGVAAADEPPARRSPPLGSGGRTARALGRGVDAGGEGVDQRFGPVVARQSSAELAHARSHRRPFARRRRAGHPGGGLVEPR